jgi:hypothetical protein
MFLVIHKTDSDPVAKAIADHRQRLSRTAIVLSTQDVMSKIAIDDEIIDGNIKLCWEFEGLTIRNTSDVLLINRAQPFEADDFPDYHEEDQEFASAEATAYLSYALAAFPHTTAYPNFFGISGSDLPLPFQWKVMAQANLSVGVPRYYMGAPQFSRLPLDGFVCGDIYSFHHWSPGTKSKSPLANLFYERPAGVPVFALVVGTHISLHATDGRQDLSAAQRDLIIKASKFLADDRRVRIFEALFFVDGDTITFGCLNASLKYTSRLESFVDNVIEGIETLALN